MQNSKFFKVYTGYGETDYISIDETELEMCIRAQITGKVAITKDGTITGNVIQRIVPDWNKALGLNRGYKMKPEDYEYLPKKVADEHRDAIALATSSVQSQLKLGNISLPRLPQ